LGCGYDGVSQSYFRFGTECYVVAEQIGSYPKH
jgi:hypothetical protein